MISWGIAGETASQPLKQMHQKIIKIIESKSISNCSFNTPSIKLSITKIYNIINKKLVNFVSVSQRKTTVAYPPFSRSIFAT